MKREKEQSWRTNIVVAENEDAYYACFGAATQGDPDKTTTFERDYEPLERKIKKLLVKELRVPEKAFEFFDDWCPNRTRHVFCEARYVTPEMVRGLHDLLVNKYQFWRIELLLEDSMATHNMLGAVAINGKWLLCFGTGRLVCPADKAAPARPRGARNPSASRTSPKWSE